MQSIISAFPIILGNFALHFTLAVLSYTVSVPSSEEMTAIRVIANDDRECVSSTELESSLQFLYNVHLACAIITFYSGIHLKFWKWIMESIKVN